MEKTYLALGDSMSIDDYTGVVSGGAVKQLYRRLVGSWKLIDKTYDGCMIDGVPTDLQGDLITLTIGGNDLLFHQEHYLSGGLPDFARNHRRLLGALRAVNPESTIVVGNIYRPQFPLSRELQAGLETANAMIAANVAAVGGSLADIHAAFLGHESQYLCFDIEPSLRGAEVIAALFFAAYVRGAD
jgi:hypothetical protein